MGKADGIERRIDAARGDERGQLLGALGADPPPATVGPPGAEPAYKYGIVELYAQLGVPVVPVAHVAGLYWPRRRFLRYPGVIRARFLPPIPPGLERDVFLARLIAETEKGCDDLLIEAATSPNPPPMPPTAVARLKELGAYVPAGD